MDKAEFLEKLPALVQNYQPSESTQNQLNNLSLLMIIGPSAAGKTSLMKGSKLPIVICDTTRPKRPAEEDGKDYYFLTDLDKTLADIKSGHFMQVAIGPGGELYSTMATSYPASGIAVMAVLADVVPIFRQLGFKNTVSAFVTPPTYDEWTRRLSGYDADSTQLDSRLAEAYRSYKFALGDPETHFILNDDLAKAINQLAALIDGKVQVARELEARKAAQDILSRLS